MGRAASQRRQGDGYMAAQAERSLYIGYPNGVVICIDKSRNMDLEGRIYHFYKKDYSAFYNIETMLLSMDQLFDTLNFPMRGNRFRGFGGKDASSGHGQEDASGYKGKDASSGHGQEDISGYKGKDASGGHGQEDASGYKGRDGVSGHSQKNTSSYGGKDASGGSSYSQKDSGASRRTRQDGSGYGRKEMKKIMDEKEVLRNHGELGTFIVRVQHRQHSSWQGTVTWVEENKIAPFRSALELIKLMDGALNEEEDSQKEAPPERNRKIV